MDNKINRVLFENENEKFIWIGAEAHAEKYAIRTNQYLIIRNGKGFLLDPGGLHLFSRVVSAVSQYISLDDIEGIFFSHQDPDVSSGIALWLGICPAKIYVSGLWIRFLPHFGIINTERMTGLKDTQTSLETPHFKFTLLPSHFMHSVGCFSLFDTESSILFSGDIGAEDIPYDGSSLFVEDFSSHKASLNGFHQRYMSCNAVCKRWVSRARRLNPSMIAPQHGPLFQAAQKDEFFNWLENLECGTDLLDTYYGRD